MSIASAVESGKRLMEASFLDRCALLSVELTPDGRGGTTSALVPTATNVPCRFATLNDTDIRLVGGWTQGPATGTVYLPITRHVEEGMYLQNTSADDAFWVIVGQRTPPGFMAVARRLLIREASWGVS